MRKMKRVFTIILIISIIGYTSQVLASSNENLKLVWQIDFSTVQDKNHQQTLSWLEQQGFEFFLEIEDFKLRIESGKLFISTDEEMAGLMGIRMKENSGVQADKVVLDWGVKQFTDGANWEKSVNSVSIASMFFLGEEKFSSGLPFGINSAPYFFSPFIGEKEQENKIYLGDMYQEAGRYVCVSNQSGLIQTEFDLAAKFNQNFKNHYKRSGVPPVTAVAIQMNTDDTSKGAEAFVKTISLYQIRQK
jgi:hypothetical protein